MITVLGGKNKQKARREKIIGAKFLCLADSNRLRTIHQKPLLREAGAY